MQVSKMHLEEEEEILIIPDLKIYHYIFAEIILLSPSAWIFGV